MRDIRVRSIRAEGLRHFGWVGSNSTMAYLDIVIPALNEIAERHNIRLCCFRSGLQGDAVFEIQNLRWDLANEIDNLRRIDIGLMPLYDTPVEKVSVASRLSSTWVLA